MIFLLEEIQNALSIVSQTQFSVLIYGFLVSMMSMMVGVELRVANAIARPGKRWFSQRFYTVLCYVTSILFTSVFSSIAHPLAVSNSFSISAGLITFVFWCGVILLQGYVIEHIKSYAVLFKSLYSLFVTVSFFGAHVCFMFLPNSMRIQSVYWPGILIAFVTSYILLSTISQFAYETSKGQVRPVKDRLGYIFSLVLINQFIVFSLIAFVSLNEKYDPFPWYWLALNWRTFEVFISLVSLCMIIFLVYKVYFVLDASMRALKKDRENLKEMNKLALEEVATASDTLRLKQNKIAQLEKVIRSAKNEHMLSVDSLVAALSGLEEGMFEWDIEGEEIEMSRQWCELFGFQGTTPTRHSASRWRAGFLKEDLHFLDDALHELLTGRSKNVSMQVRYKTPHGSLLKLEIRMVAVRNPYGLSGKVVGVFHDRTEEMDLELSIRQELSEESLLSTRKTQFVSYLAHEIRTPMTIISSAKALLELTLNKTPYSPESAFPYVDQIGTALNALRSLVDETLMFMGTSYSRNQIHVEKIDVQALINSFSEVEQKRRYMGRSIQIQCSDRLAEIEFFSDETVLSQIIRHFSNYVLENSQNDPSLQVFYSNEKDVDCLSISFRMHRWPAWMTKAGELEPTSEREVIIPFSDELLPFSLLLTKRVIRLINGRLIIKSQAGQHTLSAELPSLKEKMHVTRHDR